METEILERYGLTHTSIQVEGIKGRGWRKGAWVLFSLPYSLFQSMAIIKRFSPHLVFGVGGYSSGPVCVAAKVLGIPSAIHEQNSFPGLTNRLLCRIVDKVLISFEESRRYLSHGALYLTGNPVREEIIDSTPERAWRSETFFVLVMGGSQGAVAVNRAFVSALEILRQKGRHVDVLHQTGQKDYPIVVEAYHTKGLKGHVTPFIHDMAEAYQLADMVVSRAGASTVSELACMGKPSILIPYPFAANNHQEINARMLVQAGGAEMILEKELNGRRLADRLMAFMDDEGALKKMGEGARGVGMPDAVRQIVDQLMGLLSEN